MIVQWQRACSVLTLSFILAAIVNAQDIGPLQADRPDQTESPSVVPHDHFQFESGFAFEHASSTLSSIAHPSVLLKYGIRDFVEVRLILELTSVKVGNNTVSGLNPVTAGFKVRMLDEDGIIPMTSFLGHVSFPRLASSDFKAKYYAPSARLAMQHTLTESFSLAYNIGFEEDGVTTGPIYLYTFAPGFSLSDALGCYAELYGFASRSERARHLADIGLTYLPQPNMMVDFSAGVGLTSNAPDFFVAVGFSTRLWE